MKMSCEVTYLNKDVKTSKKGNQYTTIAIMQGTETTSLMLVEGVKVPDKIQLGQQIMLELDVNMRYKDMKVLAFNLV